MTVSWIRRQRQCEGILWASTKHFCYLERSSLLLLCGIGYNVINGHTVNSSVTILFRNNLYKCQSHGTMFLRHFYCDCRTDLLTKYCEIFDYFLYRELIC